MTALAPVVCEIRKAFGVLSEVESWASIHGGVRGRPNETTAGLGSAALGFVTDTDSEKRLVFESGVTIISGLDSESLNGSRLCGCGEEARTQFGVMSTLCSGEGVSLSESVGIEEQVNIEEPESYALSREGFNSAAGLSPKAFSP